ncbi:MAG: zinc-binding dehydrogenase [Bdellovibrionales bacterium]|nr:zinc-binding dehydrogenase [Bdellovibrionales bacterium]
MKALFFRKHGSFDNLEFGDLELLPLAPDYARIRVKSCALNHLDLWVLGGWPGLNLALPHIGGSDIAGEIAELGSAVSGWDVGARVAVNPGYLTGHDEWTLRGEESVSPHYRIIGEHTRGGFAEFVDVPAANLVSIPDSISFTNACAGLLVGLTAWRMLVVRGGLAPGKTVLIVGAGGGVNSFCIQLARSFGAEVIALTSSEEKMARAAELGAQHVVNYKKEPNWSKAVWDLTDKRGVDIVVDNVGAATMEQSLRAAARGGSIVTVGNTSGHKITFDNRLIFAKQLSLIGSTMGSRRDFEEVSKLLWDGRIKPVVDRELPLAEGRTGYEILEHGEQFGKVVLIP